MKKLLKFLPIMFIATFVSFALALSDATAFPREGKTYFNMNLGYGIDNPTTTFTGTVNTTVKPMDRGYVADVGFGYYLLDELRVALNPVYARNLTGKKTTGSSPVLTDKNIMNHYGIFGNIYYDILTGGKINPFIMGGIGFMRTEVEDRVTITPLTPPATSTAGKNKGSRSKLAYQIGGGFAYHLSSSIDVELGYKILKHIVSKKKSNGTVGDTIGVLGVTVQSKEGLTQIATIGLRFTF
jgi:opacity protein-like surface antigen